MESWDCLEIVVFWGFILEILRFKKGLEKLPKLSQLPCNSKPLKILNKTK
jgi:hypothetical protein